MAGYPHGSSPGYGYGAPPPPGQQPYGSSGAYGGPPPPPGPQAYGAYGGAGAPPPPGPQAYGSSAGGYGAPPSAQPYGHGDSSSQYGAPPGSQPGTKPPKNKYDSDSQNYGGGYQPSAPPHQQPPPPYGFSPFAALVPSAFPPGTDPNIVAYFQMADQDGSGFIDDKELQKILSSYSPQSFSLRTIHLLMYLFTNSNVRKIGPKEFIAVYYSLQSWRAIFDRFDSDRSGKIDSTELRDALLSLGFAVPPAVLDLLISKFDKTGGRNKAIEYDNFIECCLTVKGLTEKFKEKDTSYLGSANFTYETFMLTVLPFLIA